MYFRLDEIQSENMKYKVENSKLVRKVDSIKNENHNIGVMEQEKDSLKQTVAQMKATIDSLQKTQSKQVINKIVSLATTIVETWLFILKHKFKLYDF